MTPREFSDRLARIESTDNPEAWGDHGLAMGRWQVHPAWLWDYGVQPAPAESWDSVVRRSVEEFFRNRPLDTPVQVAMLYHLGHRGWDETYAEKFIAAVPRAAV